MFEHMNEMLKGQPDWLEVPINAELLEKANERLRELGTTMEDAVRLLVMRTIDHGDEMLKMKEDGVPPEAIVAKLCSSVVWEIQQNAEKQKSEEKPQD